MSSLYDKVVNILAVVPVILMMVLTNVLIACVISFVVFIQLLTVAGWGKTASMVVAILVAAATHAYIILQPRLNAYIKSRSSF